MATTETTTAETVAAPPARSRRKQKAPAAPKPPWWLWIVVAAIVLFCLAPFYWLINVSLKTGPDLSGSAIVPPHPTLDNYRSIFHNDDFVKALGNSAIVSLTTTALALLVGS